MPAVNLQDKTIDLNQWSESIGGELVGNNPGGGSGTGLRTGFYSSAGSEDPNTPATAPPRGQPGFVDINYNTRLLRATDQPNDFTDGGYTGFFRQEYSRKQIFNFNETRFLALAANGFYHAFRITGGIYTYDRILNVSPFPASDCELNWHPTDPDIIIYTAYTGGLVFYQYSFNTGLVSTYFDLRAVAGIGRTDSTINAGVNNIVDVMPGAIHAWTKAEGSPSWDGDIWGFMVEDVNYNLLGFAIYRVSTDEIISYILAGETIYDSISDADIPIFRPDHCSVTPDGLFFVPSWLGQAHGTRAMDVRDLTNQVKLHHTSEHSDLGMMPSGNPVFVSLAFQGGDGTLPASIGARGGFFAQEIFFNNGVASATLIDLTQMSCYVAGLQGVPPACHISTQCQVKAGYFLYSAYTEVLTSPPGHLDYKLAICEIADGGEVYHLGRSHNIVPGYFGETQATWSRLGNYAAFCSGWKSGLTADLEMYHYADFLAQIPDL